METYIIKKTNIDNVPIDSSEWAKANLAEIKHEAPDSTYAPLTYARLLYSDGGITVKFETDEKPLRMTQTERDGDIFEDSCVEFFICPEGSGEYLNFEMNPLGTLHLGLGKDRYERKHVHEESSVFDIKCTFENDKWQLKVYLPFKVVDNIFGSHGSTFCGNLYKCGDKTEREHYLMWNNIPLPKADFHQMSYFGKFILE